MDAAAAIPQIRFNRILPYWAVLRTDIRTVFRSWAFWLWVGLFVLISAGHVIYRYATMQAGAVTDGKDNLTAATQTTKAIQMLLTATLALITFLSVSAISSERNTLADSVLSRGISRWAYYLAKWHSRLISILGTFSVLSLLILFTYRLLLGVGTRMEMTGLETELSYIGSFLAVLLMACILSVVVSTGVTIGAVCNSTIMGITVAWIGLYGGLIIAAMFPSDYPTPNAVLGRMAFTMQGYYDTDFVWRVVGYSTIASLIAGGVGMIVFNRKDV